MNWFLKALKDYAVFTGRSRRKEYWMFFLFYIIAYYALIFLGMAINTTIPAVIFSLAFLVPSIAVAIRRMHDVGKSGWFILIPIYNLILACTDGTVGDNEYGPDPKGRAGFGADDYQKPYDITT